MTRVLGTVGTRTRTALNGALTTNVCDVVATVSLESAQVGLANEYVTRVVAPELRLDLHLIVASPMTAHAAPVAEPEQPAAPPEPSFEERFLVRFFRPNLLLLAAFIGTAIVMAPAAAKFVPVLEHHPDYRMKTTDIVVPTPPQWVPSNFLGQIIKRADLPAELSVLDRNMVLQVGQAFESHPWVTGQVRVRVTIPARIEVTFEYREPVAMVSINDGFYPVDADGLLLPPDDFPLGELKLYPRIIGIGAPPSGKVGESWGDERVTAAARLAHVIAPYWTEFQLEAIEAPKRESADLKYDELEFVLISKGGSRIIWGRAPGNGHPLEVTDDQKIGRLKEFLAKGKSFDGPWEININHLMEIITWRELEKPKVQPKKTDTRRRSR
jgi:hypothetical protein